MLLRTRIWLSTQREGDTGTLQLPMPAWYYYLILRCSTELHQADWGKLWLSAILCFFFCCWDDINWLCSHWSQPQMTVQFASKNLSVSFSTTGYWAAHYTTLGTIWRSIKRFQSLMIQASRDWKIPSGHYTIEKAFQKQVGCSISWCKECRKIGSLLAPVKSLESTSTGDRVGSLWPYLNTAFPRLVALLIRGWLAVVLLQKFTLFFCAY